MDLKKLSTGDKVIGVSGILLFIFSLLPVAGLQLRRVLGVAQTPGRSRFAGSR